MDYGSARSVRNLWTTTGRGIPNHLPSGVEAVGREAAIREVEGGPVLPQDEPTFKDRCKRFETELAARGVSDPSRNTFGQTKYTLRQAWPDGLGLVTPFPAIGIFFAYLPQPFVGGDHDRLLKWMDCNSRRYEPCTSRHFIPSVSHTIVPKGFLWGPPWEIQQPRTDRYYTRYLSVETTGWIEYGYYPAAEWEEETDRIYYAKIVASSWRS